MSINIEISVGELLDKLTILEIKRERITDDTKLENVNKEFYVLNKLWEKSPFFNKPLEEDIKALKQVNEKLWVIEDEIRNKERNKTFDEEFIDLARSVYFTNDERAEIKRRINLKTDSELVEEKSYKDY